MLVTLINSKSSSLPPPVLLVSKPSDPSPPPPLSLSLRIVPFHCWSPRATPAAGCESKECMSLYS